MAELVAGAFFTVSFERFFNMILSGEVLKFVRGKKLNDGMLKKFKTMLLSVKALLNDAEKKQISDPDVRQWLVELKDTMYHAEDLAYEIETEALRCKIEGGESRSRIFQVFNFSSRFNVKNLEDRIVEIFDTLEGIMRQQDRLGLSPSEGVHQNRSSSSSPQLLPVEEESHIYGRDHDKAVIVKLLLSDDHDDVVGGDNNISVIPIVGMGGIGKTTLAQLVYNDVSVMKKFNLKAWVTVSNEFDVFTLTKIIFELITEQKDCGIKHPEQLQCELKNVIQGKKFLFVLDDVWNEDYDLWYNLKSQFAFGASGSRIIVTTRSKNIGCMMGEVIPNLELGTISDEDSWQLFTKHAFQKIMDQSALQEFEEIGKKIVGKCNGLPLAIKSLGGLLRSKNHIHEWEDILNSDLWELDCQILPALWLSYHYLPPHLKRCFAYCSIFPKKFNFIKENLILLWMAEDLLRPQQNRTLEEIGEKYFNDLVSRSFFHHNERDHFTMHDLINDLATFVSREFCLRLDDDYSKVLSEKTRHLCYMKSNSQIKLEEYLSKSKVLRNLLFVYERPEQSWANLEQYLKGMECLRVLALPAVGLRLCPLFKRQNFIPTKALDLIGNLKLLRYLDLSGTDIKELSDTICTLYNLQTLLLRWCSDLYRLSSSIGKLKHLRCLNLSWCTNIKELPDALCDLSNLHTLDLLNCTSLSSLPTHMSRLINLHYLDFSDTKVTGIPPQMGKLKHLQHLSPAFLVDKNGGCNIGELGNLHDLRGSLTIKNLESIVNVGDVREAKLKDKRHITVVELEWCGETDDSKKAREVLEGLQPHTNVQKLRISNYKGTKFPRWIGHHSFSHIVYVSLSGCSNCYLLPPLGQLPSLKDLELRGFEMVERIGDEFYYSCSSSSSSGSSSMITALVLVPFKSLESLRLKNFSELREWKEWSLMMGGDVGGEEGTRAFPLLKTLKLSGCPKINGDCLPSNFPSSTTLVTSEGCQQLLASLQSHQLPWLGELKIFNCSGVVSFPPQGGLPSNIHKIVIDGCHELKSLAKQGWPSNLKSLRIESCKNLLVDVDSFPEEGQLPTTLTRLKLVDLEKLKSLNGKALRDLVCLERLSIKHCHQLSYLPKGRLPDSLSRLTIRSSLGPLAHRCNRDTGIDWPKIAHIPRIKVINEKEAIGHSLQSVQEAIRQAVAVQVASKLFIQGSYY